jgi:uncharacterized coiled-coil DUF342 family protein
MAWLLDMTRAEKEQYVIELYKQNRTVRQIAELTHMSFRDIGGIIHKVKAKAERERGQMDEEFDNKLNSKETQAFRLFSEGKTPVDVVIALDLQADEVRAIYRDYWALNDMHKLVEIYDQTKYSLPYLLKLYRIVNAQGMGEQEIINVLKLANNNELSYLQDRVEYLRGQINILELKKTKCTTDILTLNRRIDEFKETANLCESYLNEKREEVSRLNQELRRLDNLDSNNDNVNKNDDGIEIFYATGSWQFPEKLE